MEISHRIATAVLPLNLLISFSVAHAQVESKSASDNTNQSLAIRQRVARAQATAIADVAERVERDVTYGRVGDVELKMDIYHPKGAGEKPLPVVMYVHGGGWRSGDKAGGAGMMAIPELLKRGYLVTSINYRLAPEYKFPAQIDDAKCAVRFLRAHAKKYNLDPERIGIWGGSAGGHMVALMGTADASAGFDKSGGWTNESSRVQAVVDMFGPADLSHSMSPRAS